MIRLLLFEKFFFKERYNDISDKILFPEVLIELVKNWQINENEYFDCRGFIFEALHKIPGKENLFIIGGNKNFNFDINYQEINNFSGQLFFLYLKSVNILLFYYKVLIHLYLITVQYFKATYIFAIKVLQLKAYQLGLSIIIKYYGNFHLSKPTNLF